MGVPSPHSNNSGEGGHLFELCKRHAREARYQLAYHKIEWLFKKVGPFSGAAQRQTPADVPQPPRQLPHPNKRTTKAERDSAVADYQAGVSVQDIAERLGVSTSWVHHQVKAAGVAPHNPTPPAMTHTQIAKAVQLRDAGQTFTAIGRMLGFHSVTVSAQVRKAKATTKTT